MKNFFSRIINMEIKKSWIWLVYIDLVLPLCLFMISFLLKESGVGHILARIFHSYNLYILNPIPDFKSLTGLLGLAIHIGMIVYALKRKDIKDTIICLLVTLLASLYIIFELNYSLSYLLKFV